ncbi:NAD(+)/NADH kinase [Haloparvum sedimenti]|uniref:NAD(+)/NADH kinase n=1 Tax=Haloparvum sedimenti TaxID=1678448 RepID=UPI00071E969D|nr:NAD(+)/NADH kinase [Haloparvum sedimenti]
MQVGIVAQRENPRAASLADDLRSALRERDVGVWFDEATAAALDASEVGRPMDAFDGADLVVAVGGDGTFLFAGRHAGGTPILGVNLGEVGFLNAVPPDDAREAVLREVDAYRGEGMTPREVPRIAARVEREEWTSDPAANEIVVQGPRRGHGGGTDYEVRVDGSLYSGGHADGVLIATPTGSSAYNLSEDGPLVHPSVDTLVVNEMCAAEGMPPLAVEADSTVTVTLTGEGTTGVVISDGRHPKEVEAPVSVTVERTDPPMRIAGPSADYFEALGKLS